MTSSLLIQPRDTALFRDARPFNSGANRARSLNFPWPSTTTGFVRTMIGSTKAEGFVWTPERARGVKLRGPFLVSLVEGGPEQDSRVANVYVPAPMDVAFFPDGGLRSTLRRVQLVPKAISGENEVYSPLPEGVTHLVTLGVKPPAGKAVGGPAFWSLDSYMQWLIQPQLDETVVHSALGIDPLVRELRTHVALTSERTAADGHMFQTEALRFVKRLAGGVMRFGLLVETDEPVMNTSHPTIGALGGERRPSGLNRLTSSPLPPCPELPDSAVRRVQLMTPGIFTNGWSPKRVLPSGATIFAALVGRPLSHSGWDFEKNRARATRRMAPAGTTYWIRFSDSQEARAWTESHWFHSICDDAQDVADGFGIAAIGVA